MKKKSRRSGPGEQARPEGVAEEEAAEARAASSDDGGDEAAAGTSTGGHAGGDAGGKKSLPAFGFAADLLKKAAADQAPTAKPVAAPEAAARAAEAASPMSLDEAFAHAGAEPAFSPDSAPQVDGQAPTRVFDFADRLDDGGRRGEQQAAPVKIGTFVAFDLAGETFAMPVEPVRQVVRVSSITRVPHAPRPIRGVTNLRGRVIPVIDLRLRIGLPETEISRSSRVVSVSSRGRLIGLLVDAVHQVLHLDLYKVQPPPDDVMTMQSDYIEGVYGEGDDLILLLDIDKALIIREAGAA